MQLPWPAQHVLRNVLNTPQGSLENSGSRSCFPDMKIEFLTSSGCGRAYFLNSWQFYRRTQECTTHAMSLLKNNWRRFCITRTVVSLIGHCRSASKEAEIRFQSMYPSVTSQETCVFFGFFSSDKSMTSAQADNFDQNGRMNIN